MITKSWCRPDPRLRAIAWTMIDKLSAKFGQDFRAKLQYNWQIWTNDHMRTRAGIFCLNPYNDGVWDVNLNSKQPEADLIETLAHEICHLVVHWYFHEDRDAHHHGPVWEKLLKALDYPASHTHKIKELKVLRQVRARNYTALLCDPCNHRYHVRGHQMGHPSSRLTGYICRECCRHLRVVEWVAFSANGTRVVKSFMHPVVVDPPMRLGARSMS